MEETSVIFTKHADKKFDVLKSHKCIVSRDQVLDALCSPDYVDMMSRAPLRVAQKGLDKKRVIRVVSRRGQYGSHYFLSGQEKTI